MIRSRVTLATIDAAAIDRLTASPFTSVVVGWGSTLGSIEEAVDRARDEGHRVSSLHLRFIYPLEPGLDEIFDRSAALPRLVRDAARIIVDSERPRLLGGIALVENAFKETAIVQHVPMDDFDTLLDAESALRAATGRFIQRFTASPPR